MKVSKAFQRNGLCLLMVRSDLLTGDQDWSVSDFQHQWSLICSNNSQSEEKWLYKCIFLQIFESVTVHLRSLDCFPVLVLLLFLFQITSKCFAWSDNIKFVLVSQCFICTRNRERCRCMTTNSLLTGFYLHYNTMQSISKSVLIYEAWDS